ncbi:hypothetical protein BJ956_001233 [Arthrobacter psychrochitiniphilus]|nr:hypothetical protein [Arthrobacter psychrochitiniphilus]
MPHSQEALKGAFMAWEKLRTGPGLPAGRPGWTRSAC